MSRTSTVIKYKSVRFIKPNRKIEEATRPYDLSPWGLSFLPFQYLQNGILFSKPPFVSLDNLLDVIEHAISVALVHFYPLAGQLATRVDESQHKSVVFVDCNKGPGVKLVHATRDVTMSDILAPTYTSSPVVYSLFDLNGVTNYDGHTQPLVSAQVTELLDGIFVGVSMNHAVVDGTSFQHGCAVASELLYSLATGNQKLSVPKPPIHDCLLPLDHGHPIALPYTHRDEFIVNYTPPDNLKSRIFHFSPQSIHALKQQANEETNSHKITSLQALTALLWRSIAKANNLPHAQPTHCGLAIDNRHVLDPPLPPAYFRTSVSVIKATTTAGELAGRGLGWVAMLVPRAVASHDDKSVRESLRKWAECPVFVQPGTLSENYTVAMTHSPRFDVYRNQLGFGRGLALRHGRNNMFAGKVAAYAGSQGGGSMDVEIYLPQGPMEALELDKEFMDYVDDKLPGLSERYRTEKQAKL